MNVKAKNIYINIESINPGKIQKQFFGGAHIFINYILCKDFLKDIFDTV